MGSRYRGSNIVITKQEINEAIDQSGIERYRTLCWRHPDIRTRAGFQATVIQKSQGWTGCQLHPPIELLRATPAGQKIPADESPLIQPVQCCGPNGRAGPGPVVFLDEDQE
jgi:hypothetical protein